MSDVFTDRDLIRQSNLDRALTAVKVALEKLEKDDPRLQSCLAIRILRAEVDTVADQINSTRSLIFQKCHSKRDKTPK